MWVIVVPATIARSTPVGVFMRSSAVAELLPMDVVCPST